MSAELEAAHVQECREWQATLAEHGWAGITWPKEYGGRGGTVAQARIFAQEESRFLVSSGVFMVATGMVGLTIISHGTDEQKDFFLRRMLNGEHVWCQLFSEPGAGSDLAGLTTRADVDGDELVVNGQKVWTSGAHFSDWGMMLARTNWDVPKHQGISWIAVDMRTPGIEVRPLRQITGYAHFNEVFLTDVRVPVANIVGGLHNGWGVALTTLGNERQMIGGGGAGIGLKTPPPPPRSCGGTHDPPTPPGLPPPGNERQMSGGGGPGIGSKPLLALARSGGRTDAPTTRQDLARSYTRFELLNWLGQRAKARAKAGLPPGPEVSVMKLAVSQRVAADGDLALALEGPDGMLIGEDAPDAGTFQQLFLNQWSVRIGGGTEQIQRNVLGERVLGLPGEPRPDKTAAFRDLPRN